MNLFSLWRYIIIATENINTTPSLKYGVLWGYSKERIGNKAEPGLQVLRPCSWFVAACKSELLKRKEQQCLTQDSKMSLQSLCRREIRMRRNWEKKMPLVDQMLVNPLKAVLKVFALGVKMPPAMLASNLGASLISGCSISDPAVR